MSLTHTQGELTVTESEYEPNRFTIRANGNWIMTIQHNGESMIPQQRENLRRLAACWNAFDDMLEALRKTAAELRQIHAKHYGDCKDGCPTHAALANADAAIKKATGEAP